MESLPAQRTRIEEAGQKGGLETQQSSKEVTEEVETKREKNEAKIIIEANGNKRND